MKMNPAEKARTKYAEPIHPFRMLITGVEGDVLYVLAKANREETAAEIARLSGRSKTQVQAVLDRLHKANLINRTFYERWSWNCLNEDHPFTPHIQAMAGATFNVER